MSGSDATPGRDHVGVGVGTIVVDAGRVLLLKRKKEPEAGLWGIQGGAVEFGETVEAAARRELEEELGVGCEIVGLLGVTDHILPRKAPTGSRRSSWRRSGPAAPQGTPSPKSTRRSAGSTSTGSPRG